MDGESLPFSRFVRPSIRSIGNRESPVPLPVLAVKRMATIALPHLPRSWAVSDLRVEATVFPDNFFVMICRAAYSALLNGESS